MKTPKSAMYSPTTPSSILASFALLLVSLMLSGCNDDGGNASSDSPATLTATRVASTVTLPASPNLPPLQSLVVRTSGATSDVDSAGSSEVVIFNDGPQYTEVLDSNGRIVLAGYISPDSVALNAESTARTIAYLVLAGPWMQTEGRMALLTDMHTLAGFADLVTAVETTIARDGYFDVDSAEFLSAMTGFADTHLPNARVSTLGLSQPRGVIAEPTTTSGLSLDTTVESKLTVQNVYLRRVVLFLRRTGHVTAAGDIVDESTNPFTRVEMKLVGRYGGITGTIDGYLKGDVAYSPVSTNPALDIPRFPADATKTSYEMYAIGPGFGTNSYYNTAPQAILDDLDTLELKALLLDVVLVFVANVALPLNGSEVDDFLQFVGGNAVVTDIIGNLKTNIPALGEQLGTGDYSGAMRSIFTATYTSNAIIPAFAQLAVDFIDQNSNLSDVGYEKIVGSMSGVIEKMGKIDVGFTVADLGVLFHDIAQSQKVERFDVTVTEGKITLDAGRTLLRPSSTTTIKAIIQDRDPAGTYEFQWTVAPNTSYWVEDRFLNGTDDSANGILITSEDAVNIRSLVSSSGSATVTCTAYRVDNGRREVGNESIAIQFDVDAPNTIVERYGVTVISSVFELSDGGRWGSHYAAYYDVPKTETAFGYRFTGVSPDGTTIYSRLKYEPVADANVFVQQPPNALLIPPLPGTFRVWVRGGSGAVVGGHPTQGEAQANLDIIVAGVYLTEGGNTHTVEAFLPD